MAGITFVVPGVRQEGISRGSAASTDSSIPGTVTASVRVTTQRTGGGENVRLEAIPGEDTVVLHIANGPSLWLHPETARDLLEAQHDPAARGGTGEIAPGEVRVPVRLQWRGEDAAPTRGLSRGFLGDVILKGVDIVRNLITDLVTDKAADFAASKVVQGFDTRVTEGVYQLQKERLEPLKGANGSRIPGGGQPALVLIHGTFSDTVGTFGKLWTDHAAKVRELFQQHDGRVFALDHATLGRHPVSNALTLAKALETGARLRLLTHSRGGLVAEVLACAAAMSSNGFADPADWLPDHVADLRGCQESAPPIPATSLAPPAGGRLPRESREVLGRSVRRPVSAPTSRRRHTHRAASKRAACLGRDRRRGRHWFSGSIPRKTSSRATCALSQVTCRATRSSRG